MTAKLTTTATRNHYADWDVTASRTLVPRLIAALIGDNDE